MFEKIRSLFSASQPPQPKPEPQPIEQAASLSTIRVKAAPTQWPKPGTPEADKIRDPLMRHALGLPIPVVVQHTAKPIPGCQYAEDPETRAKEKQEFYDAVCSVTDAYSGQRERNAKARIQKAARMLLNGFDESGTAVVCGLTFGQVQRIRQKIWGERAPKTDSLETIAL